MRAEHWIVAAAAIFVAIALSGCESAQPSNVGRVSGKITLEGQPLPDALVRFTPVQPGGSSALGKTDSDGNYKLSYASGIEGAEIGQNRVSISTYTEGDPDGDPPRPKVPEKVPIKYNAQTELTADVKAGDNEFDFPLKIDGPIMTQPPESSCGCGGE
jgi:hypothetical protein